MTKSKKRKREAHSKSRNMKNNAYTVKDPPDSLNEAFCMMVQRKFDILKTDSSISSFSFAATLNNTQRCYIHTKAKKSFLFTKSTGSGSGRRLHLSRELMNAKQEKIQRHLPPQLINLHFPEKLGLLLSKYEREIEAEYERCCEKGGQESKNALERLRAVAPRRVNFRPLRPLQKKRSSSRSQDDKSGTLPVHKYKKKILKLIHRNQVVVISGDTGCGKSTQIPQFVLDDAIASGTESSTRIVCTQPRRLSAISLAARVRQERNCTTSQVGHAVRFEAHYDARHSKLIFCTTGTLLKWLNGDPEATSFSHLIIDEAHERDRLVDFVLILLKTSILEHNRNLKVILMSATIEESKFATYFQPKLEVPVFRMENQRCFPVDIFFLEETLLLLQTTSTTTADRNRPHSGWKCANCSQRFSTPHEFGTHAASCFDTGHESPAPPSESISVAKKTPFTEMLRSAQLCSDVEKEQASKNYFMHRGKAEDKGVDHDLISRLIAFINEHASPSESILVFLPGWDDICCLERALYGDGYGYGYDDHPKLMLVLLHSRLSPQEQQRAFEIPKTSERKVILATNIAETSLTIEDVVYVIDSGKSKQSHALAVSAESSFVSGVETTWCSQANCVQRSGRAGRVGPGVCFRVFTKARFNGMNQSIVPEILNTPLEDLLLDTILSRWEGKLHFGSVTKWFTNALDPPSSIAMEAALQRLTDIGALTPEYFELTLVGWYLSRMTRCGLTIPAAQMVLWGHFFGHYTMAMQTACVVSDSREPFIYYVGMHPDDRQRVRSAKFRLMSECNVDSPPKMIEMYPSDHYVFYQALLQYATVRNGHGSMNVMQLCKLNMLNRSVLEQINNTCRSTTNDLVDFGLSRSTQFRNDSAHPSERFTAFFAILCPSLYPNLLSLQAIGKSRRWASRDNVKVAMDNSSCVTAPVPTAQPSIYGPNVESIYWLMYQEMTQHKDVRTVKLNTRLPSLLVLLLMGRKLEIRHKKQDDTKAMLVLDEWIQFSFPKNEAKQIVYIRNRIHAAFFRHLQRCWQRHSGENSDNEVGPQPEEDREFIDAVFEWLDDALS